jgi:hypothetical protein
MEHPENTTGHPEAIVNGFGQTHKEKVMGTVHESVQQAAENLEIFIPEIVAYCCEF